MDGRMDRWTDTSSHRDARTNLTRPIGQRCVLSILRYAFCDGGSGGFGGGVGGGGGGGRGGVGSDCGSGILSPRMILSS